VALLDIPGLQGFLAGRHHRTGYAASPRHSLSAFIFSPHALFSAFPRSRASSDRASAWRSFDVVRPLQRADVCGLGGSERAVISVDRFPDWQSFGTLETIRDEAVSLFDEGFIRLRRRTNDWGFYSFFKSGWKRFYPQMYDDLLPSARALCPKTVELVNSIQVSPAQCCNAAARRQAWRAIAILSPGSLRYHLGLVTSQLGQMPNPGRWRGMRVARRAVPIMFERDLHSPRGEHDRCKSDHSVLRCRAADEVRAF